MKYRSNMASNKTKMCERALCHLHCSFILFMRNIYDLPSICSVIVLQLSKVQIINQTNNDLLAAFRNSLVDKRLQ